MRLNRLDLNLLVALDVLLHEQSVARAAERLNLTQPAVSNSLAKLRTHFEDDLLVRVGRRMQPTDLAIRMQEPVRRAILELQSITELRAEFDPSESSREFTIAASDYASVTFLSKVTCRLHDVSAGTRLRILPLTNASIALFERGEIDFLLLPDTSSVENQPGQTIFNESYTCLASRANRKVGSKISLDEYRDQTHVAAAIDRTERPLSYEEVYFASKGISRNMAVVTHSFTQIPYFVVGTNHLGTVHRRLAEEACKSLPLKIVEPDFELPGVTLKLQWHEARANDAANRWARDVFVEVASKH